jgi:DNA-binding transcriptional MerR regulator
MPTKPAAPEPERSYPLRSAARLTGLSPHLLRAWESRYGVVDPLRTLGGARRYRAADLERLRLLKAATESGHRIGRLAGLSNHQLAQLRAPAEKTPRDRLDRILEAFDAFDAAEAQRLLSLQLSALGAVPFAHEVAMPLVREIGERWEGGRIGIACEHLATAVLRSLLGAALQPGASALLGARVVFATLAGERHELGLLLAALAAMGAGANPVYLGPEVPVPDLLHAVSRSGAAALALSLVTPPRSEQAEALAELRAGLSPETHLWVGGSGSAGLALPARVERLDGIGALEQRVALLAFEKTPAR